ncbi:MAG TPA: hypothetical protein VN132_13325 [Bdellovibrio sp.]|nr:hypothetical protein [Bdellovibrio sp.]
MAMTQENSFSRTRALGILLVFALILCFWQLLPEEDPSGYFQFIDDRSYFGIPSFWNVISNFGFLSVGLMALWQERFSTMDFNYRGFRLWIAFGILWTAWGSSYFHWHPDAMTIFWDRIPMMAVFSGVFGLIIADKFSARGGWVFAATCMIVGSLSLILWKYHLSHLKVYFIIQYLGLLLSFGSVIMFRKRGVLPQNLLLISIGFYVLAKLSELGDRQIFLFGPSATSPWRLSGHSVKHLLAAQSIWILLQATKKVSPAPIADPTQTNE